MLRGDVERGDPNRKVHAIGTVLNLYF